MIITTIITTKCRNKFNMKTSKYKGVYITKPDRSSKDRINFIYRVQVYKDGKCYKCGLYDDEIKAAKAYDKKCIELGICEGLNFFKRA